MEYFVIADEDTVLGFRYAGVEGRAVRTPEEARAALAEHLARRRAGVLILTDRVAEAMADEVDRLRFETRTPLVVQIPGPEGPSRSRPVLMNLIREAMGIKL
jgi:vacuolar-type H+-ATPase subunit F/Vma7